MNKYKKIAVAAVSVVMAGTMVVSLAGCDKKPSTKKTTGTMSRVEGFMQDAWKTAVNGYTNPTGTSSQTKLTPKVKSGTKELDYAANTTLNTYLGYDNAERGIKYASKHIEKLGANVGGDATTATVYGVNYVAGDLKPAWKALSDTLKIKFNDDYDGSKTDKHMEQVSQSTLGINGHQVFTASAGNINQQGAQGTLLNIADYLEYMPNYKAFLDANPIVRLSLTADASGAMYMIPYFDGNDDIEKFVLLRKDFVETLLDGKSGETLSTVTWKAQSTAKGLTGTASYAEAFMGQTADDSYEIDVTDPEVLDTAATKLWGNNPHSIDTEGLTTENANKKLAKTVKVKVDYGAALDAAKNESTPLGAAVKDAAGKAYTGTSGNIVDLQNFAINEKAGEVTGGKLLTILREYVKVAYKQGTNSFYVGANKKLSDVFNSAYAAWDVDLYTALGRCFVTCGSMMDGETKETKDLYLLAGREHKAQRYNDTVSMAGELYGVRGLESRYQYTYIKADGNVADARNYAATYEALDKMNKLQKEGLYAEMGDSSRVVANWTTTNNTSNTGVQALSLHDYVQTQTAKAGFEAEKSNGANPFNLAPVLTPVSKWDTNDDGTKDTTMRFTESWRGVKNTGWCISYNGVKDNADKLSASLALVDYFFSNDGQLLMTYGPMSQRGNDTAALSAASEANGGFWYAEEVTDSAKIAASTETVGGQLVVKEASKAQYFTFGNKLYVGEYYNGRQIPRMTNSSYEMFTKIGSQSFTDYARYYIGSALNIGNKDQGFEYQCTAKCGLAGSQIVNIALVNGTVKHPIQQVPAVGTVNATNWYTLAPSLLPYESDVSTAISGLPYAWITGLASDGANNMFSGASSSGSNNLMIDIMAYGLGSGHAIRSNSTANIPDTAQGVVDFLNSLK